MPKGNLQNTDTKLYSSFYGMNLQEKLLKNIKFRKPSLIQRRGLVPILEGWDVVAQAHAGSGKSEMAAMCAVELVNCMNPQCQVMVVHPYPELAIHFVELVNSLSAGIGVSSCSCVGFEDFAESKLLEQGIQIVSGTPTSILASLHRCITKYIKLVIIDSADFPQGTYMNHVVDIYHQLPTIVQTVFLCTILPNSIQPNLNKMVIKRPLCLRVNRDELIEKNQFYIHIEKEEWKFDTLVDLLVGVIGSYRTIIFFNTKRKAEWVLPKLLKAKVKVVLLHSDMPLNARDTARDQFINGDKLVMLALDSFLCAIDCTKVHAIINYDFPNRREEYVLRVGKSTLLGKKGIVINFVKKEDIRMKSDLEEFFGIMLEELPYLYEEYLAAKLNE